MMTRVGCAGILVSDTFCGPMRELPREGQLLAVDDMPSKAGGCAANVAIDLAKQGIPVDIAGCLGTDPSARVLLAGLEAAGIGCQRIVYSAELPTSKTVILLVAGQDRRYIHSFGANAAFTVEHIDRDWVRSLQVFYLGGLFLMPAFRPEGLVDLLAFCREHGVVSVVDVVIPQNAMLPGDLGPLLSAMDYFVPNDDEARRMTGLSEPLDQLRALLQQGARNVVITCGARGAVAGRDGAFWRAGVYDMGQAVDPSGCGDAFTAGLVAGIVRGGDLLDALRYASVLGASAIRALGTTDGVMGAAEAEAFVAAHELEVERGRL
jgi:sugar/nucleoside kinase (ribokinase family)